MKKSQDALARATTDLEHWRKGHHPDWRKMGLLHDQVNCHPIVQRDPFTAAYRCLAQPPSRLPLDQSRSFAEQSAGNPETATQPPFTPPSARLRRPPGQPSAELIRGLELGSLNAVAHSFVPLLIFVFHPSRSCVSQSRFSLGLEGSLSTDGVERLGQPIVPAKRTPPCRRSPLS